MRSRRASAGVSVAEMKKDWSFADARGRPRHLIFRFAPSGWAEVVGKRKMVGDDGLEPPTFSV